MHRFVIVVLIYMVCALPVSVSYADTVDYVILGPSGLSDCTFSDGNGTYTVYATLNLSAPAKALRLSAPAYCGGGGITWNYPVTGDPNTVLTVDFGGCITGSVTLFYASFDVYGCCPALLKGPSIIGPAEDSPPVLIGCDDQPRYLIPPCSAMSPLLLTPTDGATAVSLTPLMSWDYTYVDYCEEGIGLAIFTILYGTDPDNLDQTAHPLDSPEWTLHALMPDTQYFWRVKVCDDWGYYSGTMINFSDIHSFRTEGSIPVEHKTWGAVKALYKQ